MTAYAINWGLVAVLAVIALAVVFIWQTPKSAWYVCLLLDRRAWALSNARKAYAETLKGYNDPLGHRLSIGIDPGELANCEQTWAEFFKTQDYPQQVEDEPPSHD